MIVVTFVAFMKHRVPMNLRSFQNIEDDESRASPTSQEHLPTDTEVDSPPPMAGLAVPVQSTSVVGLASLMFSSFRFCQAYHSTLYRLYPFLMTFLHISWGFTWFIQILGFWKGKIQILDIFLNRSNGVPHSSENNRLPNHDTPPRKGSQLLTRFEVRNKDVV